MDDQADLQDPVAGADGYEPPAVVYLGNLDELTLVKEVGKADGTLFAGLTIGS